MVMHARKHPRLNDGYTDRHDSHLLQNTRYAEKSYRDSYDRMRELPYDRRRSVSPDEHKNTGYIHKSSYSEKNKERNERDSHDMSERKLNNVSSSIHRSSNDNHNGNDRSSKTSITNQQRDSRADVQRPGGDWSEHVSSSGDKYYYNCKSGVSQWEKPKEWAEVSCSKSSDNRSRDGRHRQMSEKEERSKHSNVDKNNDKYIRSSTCSSYSKSSDKQLSHDSKEYKSSQTLDSERYSSHSSHRTNYSSDYSSKDNFPIRRDTCYPYPSMDNYKRPRRDSEGTKSGLTNTPVKGHDHRRGDDSEEMDVSPGSTPTSSRPNSRPSSCTSTPQCPPGSTPASSTPGHPITVSAGSLSSSSCTASALQTLQKLQEAINKQMSMAQQNLNQLQSPRSGSVEASPLQILKNLAPIQQMSRLPVSHIQQQTQEEDEVRGGTSPTSVHSHRSCRSPTPSTGSETGGDHEVPDGPIGNVGLSAAGIKKDVSGLTPTLSNYVNERLIGHVLGWQADHAERQANRYREEAITIGSLHCSQVSVELKKARSLVRIAEIQSTLHEQRILFTAQQIKDLEHMKPPSYLLSD